MSNGIEKYGLIAGNGQFPFLVLESARSRKIDFVVAAIGLHAGPPVRVSVEFPILHIRGAVDNLEGLAYCLA